MAAEEAVDFSAIGDAIKAGFESLQPEIGPRQVVSAGHSLQVSEPSPYRFDGVRGEHDFSSDLITGLRDRDGEALARVQTFMADAFTGPRFVSSADTAALTPPAQRPELYVDNLEYVTPIYSALFSGNLADSTPFIFPKFVSAADLVADHAEGVEPDPGSFVTTNQTVTPAPVSGRVEIPREVWDAGGNPQVSGLIWTEMQRAYAESLETKANALLAAIVPGAGGAPASIDLTTGAQDAALVDQVEAALAGLQFVRGGNRFRFMPTHVDLYLRLAAAKDGDGRKLLPMLAPTNASGSADPLFSSLMVGGQRAVPAWALGAVSANASKSYLVNPDDAHVWNSAPQRLDFEYRVAYVDLAIWGYVATAVSRVTGVRVLTYDPTV